MTTIRNVIDELYRQAEEHRAIWRRLHDMPTIRSLCFDTARLHEELAASFRPLRLDAIRAPLLDAIASIERSRRFIDEIDRDQRQLTSLIASLRPDFGLDRLIPPEQTELFTLPPSRESVTARRVAELEQRVADLEEMLTPTASPATPADRDDDDDEPNLHTGQYL